MLHKSNADQSTYKNIFWELVQVLFTFMECTDLWTSSAFNSGTDADLDIHKKESKFIENAAFFQMTLSALLHKYS